MLCEVMCVFVSRRLCQLCPPWCCPDRSVTTLFVNRPFSLQPHRIFLFQGELVFYLIVSSCDCCILYYYLNSLNNYLNNVLLLYLFTVHKRTEWIWQNGICCQDVTVFVQQSQGGGGDFTWGGEPFNSSCKNDNNKLDHVQLAYRAGLQIKHLKWCEISSLMLKPALWSVYSRSKFPCPFSWGEINAGVKTSGKKSSNEQWAFQKTQLSTFPK